MKLKVIAKDKEGNKINVARENVLYLKDSIIEVNDNLAKELLKVKVYDNPIVEKIKETKDSE